MKRNECKCIKPDGGGTSCPEQCIALCVRGRDRECQGKCIPIPREFIGASFQFTSWMDKKIKAEMKEYAMSVGFPGLTESTFDSYFNTERTESINGGSIVLTHPIHGKVAIRFHYEFDIPIGGATEDFNVNYQL